MTKPKYTPMMMQYLSIKEKHPDTLILFRLGDFYELFFDDAKIASRELQLALTGKNAGAEEKVPMCGVPHHAIQSYISKLIQRGYKVGIVEQLEDPALAKGIVERDVVQIITPGANMNLADSDNNYIVAVDETDLNYVIAYADLSTGETNVMNVEHDWTSLISELDNLLTREIVVSSNFSKETLEEITNKRKILVSYEDDDQIELEFEDLLSEVQDLYQMKAVVRLLHYLRRTQKRELDYFQQVHVIKSYRTLQIDSFSRLNLELVRTIRSEEKYGSLYWLLDHTKTAMGGRLLKHWIQKPSSDLEEILSRQSMVTSLIEHFMKREELIRALDAVYDLERLIARISFGNANGRDLLQLKTSLKAVPVLKDILNEFENENLKKIASSMDALEDIASLIEKAIREDAPITIKEGGIFLPGYNAELDELIELSHGGKSWVAELEAKERERTGIRTLKVGYNRVFGYYIEVSKGAKDLIQDDWGYERKQTTINGERFITQELKEKEEELENTPVQIDDYVKVNDSQIVGRVVRLKGNNLTLLTPEGMSIQTKLTRVKKVMPLKAPTKHYAPSGDPTIMASVKPEHNVIGMHVDEALESVEKYLDNARVRHLKTVRIIHGSGTGALRNAIHQYLKNQDFVESYRLGGGSEGGVGATVVTLK